MMCRLLLVAGLAYLLGLWTGSAFAAERCVSLTVRPTAMLISSDVDVQARVARHADHRALTVAWDSDVGAGGSRFFDLEGADDRVLFQWWNPNQPAGAYVFEARVYNARGEVQGTARAHIRSIESEVP